MIIRVRIMGVVLIVIGILAGDGRGWGAELPQEHAYQRTLRTWMLSLKADDFAVAPRPLQEPKTALSDAQKYRYWALHQYTGIPDLTGLAVPAEQYTLARIEGDKVQLPAMSSIWLAWLSTWDFAGNPYRNDRGVKLRAFVPTAVDMMMLDDVHEHGNGAANRSDFLGGTLIWLAYNYLQTRDALPAEVRTAYETGLRKLVLRLNQWGPRGLMTDMDLFAAVSLKYASDVLKEDAEVQKIAADYSRRLYTEPRFFHPAGYFVDGGCFDVSYNGISLYFNSWAATISDRDYIRDALRKAYRLRAHLTFPEPGGALLGPTHMSSRTSGDAPGDQWNWVQRHTAAAMLSDEALYAAPLPAKSALDSAMPTLLAQLNNQFAKPSTAAMQQWIERHWTAHPNFAFIHFQDEFYDRLMRLKQEDSPLLKLPMQRPGNFVENFGDTIIVAKYADFAAAIHVGPVGDGHKEWKRPFGFGGGTLSVFWQPEAGSVVLGRRRGVQGHVWDNLEEWRTLPVHAVSGITKAGGIFSSARIRNPSVKVQSDSTSAMIDAAGVMPNENIVQGKVMNGKIDYRRQFQVDAKGVHVTTDISGDSSDELAELYEIIPILRSPSSRDPEPGRARIEFKVGEQWRPADKDYVEKVTRVRIQRNKGITEISFAEPQRVKLAAEDWTDGFMSQVLCRNILVDLHGSYKAGRTASVRWSISPAPK